MLREYTLNSFTEPKYRYVPLLTSALYPSKIVSTDQASTFEIQKRDHNRNVVLCEVSTLKEAQAIVNELNNGRR